MENHQLHQEKALNFFKTADHLAYVTLPVVEDVKLMVTVLDNIHRSLVHGMNAVLEYERLYKRIMPLAENFDSRFDVFSSKIVGKYGFISDEMELIREIRKVLEDRKDASMEFTRSGKFVICNENYRMKTLSIEEIKKYLSRTKNFLLKVNRILK
jgi:hypothetical protein